MLLLQDCIFGVRYTKDLKGIESYLVKDLKGNSKEVLVLFPDTISSPFKGRSLLDMEVFASNSLPLPIIFDSYGSILTLNQVLDNYRKSGLIYQEVIL